MNDRYVRIEKRIHELYGDDEFLHVKVLKDFFEWKNDMRSMPYTSELRDIIKEEIKR